MSSWTSPDTIKSIALGRPSCSLATRSAGTPRARRYCSVPAVATIRNPSSWKRRTIGTTVGLSESFTVTKIAPASGRLPSAAICALANAIPKLSANPITSPVDRISGPRMVSTPGSFVKGKTASFTATPGSGRSSGSPSSSRVFPTVTAAAIGDRVHVALEGVLEEAVNQDRMFGRDAGGFLEVIAQGPVVVHNLHGPTAEHVGGPDQHGIPDTLGHLYRVGDRARRAVRRLRHAQAPGQRLEPLAVLGDVDRIRRRTEDRDAGRLERLGEPERRLPAELDHHSLGSLPADDLDHVLEGERLEVSLVRDVEVG